LKFLGVYAGGGLTYLQREDYKFNGKWNKFLYEKNNPVSFTYLAGFRIYPSKKISFNLVYALEFVMRR
jgi:opacity protein-like surface antigen